MIPYIFKYVIYKAINGIQRNNIFLTTYFLYPRGLKKKINKKFLSIVCFTEKLSYFSFNLFLDLCEIYLLSLGKLLVDIVICTIIFIYSKVMWKANTSGINFYLSSVLKAILLRRTTSQKTYYTLSIDMTMSSGLYVLALILMKIR